MSPATISRDTASLWRQITREIVVSDCCAETARGCDPCRFVTPYNAVVAQPFREAHHHDKPHAVRVVGRRDPRPEKAMCRVSA